jgi:hypothetical protein
VRLHRAARPFIDVQHDGVAVARAAREREQDLERDRRERQVTIRFVLQIVCGHDPRE